ncbi:MAG: protein kinase, partial [Candidatus Riflebacteria bacterium]|nr:protein kinase [Candidatus Riflebacteria bacterium]
MSRTGQTYGDYEILEMLGEGGMGEVYRARQANLDRIVAVKFISAEHYTDEINRRRFLREIRASSTLVHPNIIKTYDFGERQGDIYLVMEYLEGTP